MWPSNTLTQWARLLIGSLEQAGVRDAVITPGSRSTPFTWAATRSSGLRCRTLLDERSAGFFALGQSKLSGRPSLLICTSGSAGSHYWPALVEASQTGTPLVVLTADRPFELQDCDAPQTIDQTALFGSHCRSFVELGLPDATPGALHALRRRAAQAVAASLGPDPGPVHLNARARKPLEPEPARDAVEQALATAVDRLLGQGVPRVAAPVRCPDPGALERLADACRAAQRGLIAVGPLSPGTAELGAIAELARRTGFPLLCEATSQLRFGAAAAREELVRCDAFDLLFCSRFRESAAPDLLLQIGTPPTSVGYRRLLAAHPDVERHAIAARGWPDPQSTARSLLLAEPGEAVARLCRLLPGEPADTGERAAWRDRFQRADALAWRIVDEAVAGGDALGEGVAVRAAVESLPAGSLLALGNSLPVREVDTYCRSHPREAAVWCQRGANGIDGLISGAAGAAHASGRPTTLILGDVAFLHDVGGLWAARHSPRPLAVVVIDNDGGRIFEQLPLASQPGLDADALAPWLTPHGLDLTHGARLFGCRAARAETRAQLEQALADAHAHPGCSVVVARVAPHSAAEQRRRILARLDAELEP